MDPSRSGPADSLATISSTAGKGSITLVWALSMTLLVSSGIAYEWLGRYRQTPDAQIALPVPLTEFPRVLNGWTGEDTPPDAFTQEYMRTHFADAYILRGYVNRSTGQRANLYVVYCSSQPGGILGHNPDICYKGGGWTQDQRVLSTIVTRSDHSVACLIHRFHMPDPKYEEKVVLNFYVVNGLITANEDDFSGFWARRPNIAGDPARYVAEVEVSSPIETSALALARDATDRILTFLPDANGIQQIGAEMNVGQQESGSK